jgi:ribosome biogenesis GTPase A
VNYGEWLKWREEYYKENSLMIFNKKKLTEEQQMEAWEKHLNETDSGHRPC